MKLVYIAGPIADPDPDQREANINYACEIAAKYWDLNYSVICPHANTQVVEDYADEMTTEDWIQGEFEQLKRCDAIVLIDRWETSEGSKRELEVATQNGLEIIFDKPISQCGGTKRKFYFRLKEKETPIWEEEFELEELAIVRYLSVFEEENFSKLEDSLPAELLPLEDPEIELLFDAPNQAKIKITSAKPENKVESADFEKAILSSIIQHIEENHPEWLKGNTRLL
jgi:hypothetical protein